MQIRLLTWRLTVERVRPTAGELATRYDRLAGSWQRTLRRLGYARAYRRLFARLRSRGVLDALGSESRVLDCGIGSGALSSALLRARREIRDIHGVDLAPRMLDEARRNLAARGAEPTLRREDVRRLPYRDADFDLVMSAHVVEHLDEPRAALIEMVRVLRPGRPLIMVVTRRSWLTGWLDARWRLHCVTSDELVGWMREVGLRDVRPLPVGGPPWCGMMSVAAIGWKPEGARPALV